MSLKATARALLIGMPWFHSVSTWAVETARNWELPKVQVDFRAADGKPLSPALRTRSQWRMSTPTPSVPVRHPVLRTWIELPPRTRLEQVRASGAQTQSGSAAFTIDQRSPTQKVEAELVGPSGARQAVSISIRASAPRPYFAVDPLCRENSLNARALHVDRDSFLTYVGCSERQGILAVYFLHADTVELVQSGVRGLKHSDGRANFQFRRPRDTVTEGRSLGTVELRNKATQARSVFDLRYEPRLGHQRIRASLGTGLTHAAYKEDPVGRSNSTFSWSFRGTLDFTLVPDALEASLGGFITGLPLGSSQSNGNHPRYYGADTRLGYTLPIEMGATTWTFLGGWYFWGMLVPDRSYGVELLSAPQVFVLMRNRQAGSRSWQVYGKLALVSDETNFEIDNREIAGGIGYELTSPLAKHSLMLMLDIAHTSFRSRKVPNSFTLLMSSIGVQVSL